MDTLHTSIGTCLLEAIEENVADGNAWNANDWRQKVLGMAEDFNAAARGEESEPHKPSARSARR